MIFVIILKTSHVSYTSAPLLVFNIVEYFSRLGGGIICKKEKKEKKENHHIH